MVFPLLLIYQLAIVAVPSVVATDPISRLLYVACHGRGGYLLAQAGIAAAFLWWIHATGRSGSLALSVIAPVAIEALAVALVLWVGLPVLVHRLFGLGLGASAISAIGAGVYEELVFRLLLVGGVVLVARSAGLPRRLAAILGVVIGAAVFAAAHHLGAAGEPFSSAAFCFRLLAGLALGATFWFRSLAHAVYAHVAYDLLVLISR
jgi:Type II CAAX prenyl endopeptidase Rce1-like